jgi:hypothetical protein
MAMINIRSIQYSYTNKAVKMRARKRNAVETFKNPLFKKSKSHPINKSNLPALDDALTLDELIYSQESAALYDKKYIHPDDLYEAYDVLRFYVSDQVHLDIIKEIIEGLNELADDESVCRLFDNKTLTPKQVLDRFLYVRTDNDYEFADTLIEVIKLADLLSNVVKEFLDCGENEFDFDILSAKDDNKTSMTRNSNFLFKQPAPSSAARNPASKEDADTKLKQR